MNFNKTEEQYINNLLSTDEQLQSETLEEIRTSGNSKLLPFLIELLHAAKNEDVKLKVYNILAELKHSDSIPIIIDAIQNDKYQAEQEMLIRSCWENGLDFTPHISVFAKLVVNGDYMTAFEAFTVVENLEGTISEAESEEIITILKEGLAGAINERKVLINEIIQFIPSLIKTD